MPMQWQVSADGGYWANPDLSKKLREQAYGKMILGQFVNPIEGGLGKRRGDKVQFDRIDKVTTAGGAISESDTVPVTKMVVSQGEVVVGEYANSVEYTGKLDAISEFDPSNVIQRRLIDDAAATMDLVIRNLLKLSGVVTTPTTTTSLTWTYNGVTVTAPVDITVDHLRDIRQHMREMAITPYDDAGNYILIGGPAVTHALMADSEWQNAAHYGDPDRIFNGEVGKIYGFRIIEESQSLESPGSPTNSAGTFATESYALGADAIVEATAVPLELRYQNADYGREQGIAWYCLKGFAHTWDMTAGASSWGTKAAATGKARYIRVDGT